MRVLCCWKGLCLCGVCKSCLGPLVYVHNYSRTAQPLVVVVVVVMVMMVVVVMVVVVVKPCALLLCTQSQVPGDASGCTWRMAPQVRFVSGFGLIANGWNQSGE